MKKTSSLDKKIDDNSTSDKVIKITGATLFTGLEVGLLATNPAAFAFINTSVYIVMQIPIRAEYYKKGSCIVDRMEKELEDRGHPKLGKTVKYIFFPEKLVKNVWDYYKDR